MQDYINYIDLNAIKLADVAYDIGDFNCAFTNYSKALKRLRNYNGDDIKPTIMANDLTKKLDEISGKKNAYKSLLSFDTWKLTKSSFVIGNQCEKYLYLDKYKKEEKTPFTADKLKLFAKGHNFEDDFRDTEFQGGINIKEKVGNYAYFNSYTKYLLNQPSAQTIYEATIIEDDVLVMCDVLSKDENGLIDIYEVKLHSAINEAVKHDLAIQYYVCKKRFGENLNSFHVVLRNGDGEKNWRIIDLKPELENKLLEVKQQINNFKQVLDGPEPDIQMGEHCYKPYTCVFIEYCEKLTLKY